MATALPGVFAARSRQDGGINALLCDGSVRLLTDGISWKTWQAVGTSKGAEILGAFFRGGIK